MMIFKPENTESTNKAFVDIGNNSISYKDLYEFCDLFGNKINKRTLIFILAENTIGSAIGYVASLEKKIVPLLINCNIEIELRTNLLGLYKPEFIWVPERMIQEFDYELIFTYQGFSLLKTGFDTPVLHDSLSLLLPTSGSTGSPKLVRHSYKNIEHSVKNIGEVFSIDRNDRTMAILPMYYTMGLSVISSYLFGGATILLYNGSLTDIVFWKYIKEQKASVFTGVPYSFEILSKLRFLRMNLPDLKIISQGGGKLSNDLFNDFSKYAEKTNKKFIATYGQTEGTARMAYLPAELATSKIGSIGRPLPNGELYLLDEFGKEISKPYTPGEMVYRGENVTLGYANSLNDLQKGDERNGVLKTGDIAQKDNDGYFYIVGRISRFLKLYGTRIGLDDVERLISETFETETICTGNDELMRVYITNENIINEVTDFVTSKTGLFHQAFVVKFISKIPRNEVGKINYKFDS